MRHKSDAWEHAMGRRKHYVLDLGRVRLVHSHILTRLYRDSKIVVSGE